MSIIQQFQKVRKTIYCKCDVNCLIVLHRELSARNEMNLKTAAFFL